MRIISYFLAGAACLVLAIGCSGDDDGFTDGNSDPQRAECETKAVFSCILSGRCHEWYSDEAADAIRVSCASLNGISSDSGCGERYSACCIHVNGSNDYPEGLCIPGDDSRVPSWKEDCESTDDEPVKWCGS